MATHASWKRFGIALLVTGFGISLPGLIFLISLLVSPLAKSEAPLGWVECFHLGKFALVPLVVWALSSLYARELWPKESASRRVVGLGLLNGMIIAGVCSVHGLMTIGHFKEFENQLPYLILIVPIYLTVWFGYRAFQFLASNGVGWVAYLCTSLIAAPFWIGSILWSQQAYARLPANYVQHSCFVVTAASRGHRQIVGPLRRVRRQRQTRLANQQLLTFWELEFCWAARAPRSHAVFRRVYGFVGPRLARRINSAWRADAVYLALKPAEFTAGLIVGRDKFWSGWKRKFPMQFEPAK